MMATQNHTAFMKENELAIATKRQRKQSEREGEQRLLAYQLEHDEAMHRRGRKLKQTTKKKSCSLKASRSKLIRRKNSTKFVPVEQLRLIEQK
jgi:hypothetical protein